MDRNKFSTRWTKTMRSFLHLAKTLGGALAICTGLLLSSPSWSAPVCPIESTTSLFDIGGDVYQQYPAKKMTVSEVVDIHRRTAFTQFAEKIEAAVWAVAQQKWCDENKSEPISVNLTFIDLSLSAGKENLEKVDQLLSDIEGSYADVEINNTTKEVKGTIIWNPRQMLRDQLLLEGQTLKPKERILPFFTDAMAKYSREFKEQVLMASSIQAADIKLSELKEVMPDDLFSLISRDLHTKPIWNSGIIPSIGSKIVGVSAPGYTVLIEQIVGRAFKGDHQIPIKNILELNRTDISELYSGEWSLIPAESIEKKD